MNAYVTVMSYIDLKDIHECRVRLNGVEYNVVSLLRKDEKHYAMLAGGYYVEVGQETYEKLSQALREHFKKHVIKK